MNIFEILQSESSKDFIDRLDRWLEFCKHPNSLDMEYNNQILNHCLQVIKSQQEEISILKERNLRLGIAYGNCK